LRIEGGRGVEARLHGQLEAASADVADLEAGVAQDLVLNAERPSEDFWIDDVGNEAAGGCACVGLRGRRHVDLKQTTAGQEACASGAPCGCAGERAGDRRVLFGLQLRRQRVGGEVVGNHVV